MSSKIILCIVCLLWAWPAVNGGFFDGMNVGLTIPAMSLKVPAPGMPKIKVNADIKMPPKQSLKSMLPKFRYNIPTFMDDYYPPYSPPMEYAASGSSNQQAIAPFQPNLNRPNMRGNPKNQLKAAASDQRFNRRPNDRPHQASDRPHQTGHRPFEPNSGHLPNNQQNDRRPNGDRQPPAYAANRPLAANNNLQQPPAFGESRFREKPTNFEPIRHKPPGPAFGREMRPASIRN